MGISPDTERLARAMFRPEQVPDVLEVIGWYNGEQADAVHRAVLALSKADADKVLDLVAAATTDYRDVLMWASQPEPTPEDRAAAKALAQSLIRQAREARHRYLEGRYGAEGAEQIERSNGKLFGQGPGTSAGTD